MMIPSTRFGHSQVVRFGNNNPDQPDKPGKPTEKLVEDAKKLAEQVQQEVTFRLMFPLMQEGDLLEKGQETITRLQQAVQNPDELKDPKKAKALAEQVKKDIEELQAANAPARIKNLAGTAAEALKISISNAKPGIDQLRKDAQDSLKSGQGAPSSADIQDLLAEVSKALPEPLRKLIPDLSKPKPDKNNPPDDGDKQ